MVDIKKAYNELKKKHALPDFNEINDEFEISTIEHEDFLLREIRKKIDEKTEIFLKILNSVLQPETNITELHECKEFSEKEKERIFELYKRLMLMHNSGMMAYISCDDKDDASLISESFREWPQVKKQMLEITMKMRDAWKKGTDISDLKDEVGYLG